MNNFKIEIYKNKKWVDYSTYCVFPLKIADFLDEQLDEAELFIRRIKDEYFNPLTIVRVSIINSPECLISSVDVANIEARAQDKSIVYEYNEKTKRLTEKKERLFVIASDNAIEKPIGSGFYEHSVYLIESTKILEGFIGDSISFTNTLFGSIASTPAYFYDVSKKSYKSYFYNSVEKIGTQTIVPVIQFANNIAEEGGPGLISSGLMEGSDLFTKIITIVNQSTGETIYSTKLK